MAVVRTRGSRLAGVVSCVPSRRFDNVRDTTGFSPEEVRKVTGMAGVAARRVAGDELCSSDLSAAAGRRLLDALGWAPESVDALVFVTQTPDYFLPSTALVVHRELGLGPGCAAFDVGLGCSGYPYGLWLAAMMIQTGGIRRALVMHGETPTRFTDARDRSVALLFGDAGSATALEADPDGGAPWDFVLHSDGAGVDAMIIEAGGFRDRFSDDSRKHCVTMDGAAVFNFTIRSVPALVTETLGAAGLEREALDYFVFHQSNHFIIRHLAAKASIPLGKVPLTIQEYGNTGGVSIPLTLTAGGLERPQDRALKLMLLGYGVGLSWGSAVVDLPPGAVLETIEIGGRSEKSA